MSLKNNPAYSWLLDQGADTQSLEAEAKREPEGDRIARTLHTYPRPAWLPNWRESAAYQDHGDDLHAWAWEFLRRNPEYQAHYAYYMSVPWCYPEGGKPPKLAARAYNDAAEMICFSAAMPSPLRIPEDLPAAIPNETVGEYRQRTGAEPVRLEDALLNRYCVMHLNDPAMDEPVFFALDGGMPPYAMQEHYGLDFVAYHKDISRTIQRHPMELPGEDVYLRTPEARSALLHVLAFDLELPIPIQLEKARMVLEEAVQDLRAASEQEEAQHLFEELPNIIDKLPSFKPDKFSDFLRVFDAVWEIGWKPKEIAAELWPDKGNRMENNAGGMLATRYIAAAFSLVQGRYVAMMEMSEYPKKR